MNEHEVAFDSYTRAVQSLILDFQFIEELLKIVIGGSYEAIRRSAPSIVRFRPNRSVLEKESLGRLIQRYEEVSDNDPLIQNLRQVVGDRNFCAHRSLVLTLEEQRDVRFLDAERRRLEAVRQNTRPCVMALQAEFEALARYLQEPPNTTVERDAPQEARPSP